jgi:Mating-type protein MAT alpha 1 HMG-box
LTQKTKSGLIRSLWEQDLWKHFWAIAAKAYSELRDNHMGQITLESFLKSVIGLLGVIPADQYLATMGWALVDDSDGQVQLVKNISAAEKQNVPLTSNLSVRDIVNHCYQIGLLVRPDRSACRSDNDDAMAMSFAALPNAAKNSPTGMQSQSYQDNGQDNRQDDGQDASGQGFGDAVSE